MPRGGSGGLVTTLRVFYYYIVLVCVFVYNTRACAVYFAMVRHPVVSSQHS